MVKIAPFIVFYDGMGTGPSLRLCVDFLLMNAPPSFGSAIKQVDIYAHCRSRGRIKKTLDSMSERFRVWVQTLPKVWFRRKSQLFEIAYFSRLLYFKEMFGSNRRPLDLRYFITFCQEFGSVLMMIEERLKPTDDFDLTAFRTHIEQRLSDLPNDDSGLRRLQEHLET
jgi:hypothetical protein